MTLAEARAMTLPFGIHHGKTLARVEAEDRTYLSDFMSGLTNLDATLQTAIQIVLEGPAAKAPDPAQQTFL